MSPEEIATTVAPLAGLDAHAQGLEPPEGGVPASRGLKGAPRSAFSTAIDARPSTEPYAGIRLTEVIAGLSRALDMAEGQPPGHSIRSAMIGMRVASAVGICDDDRSALFYTLLLKDLGSSANAAQLTSTHGGDDRLLKAARKLSDWTDRSFVSRAFAATRYLRTPLAEAWRAVRDVGHGRRAERELATTRAERGAAIAAMLAMPRATCDAIRSVDEHWDGSGTPRGVAGDTIPLLARVVCLAQTAEVFARAFDPAAAHDVVRRRSGRWFDPGLVAAFESLRGDDVFWGELRRADDLEALRTYEPPTRVVYADELRLDTVAEAFARVIDAKSPFTARHSQNVSFLASRTAMELDLSSHEVRAIRRAGLLHDIGKLGVSNAILDKPSQLSPAERVEMQGHTRNTFAILRDVPRFARFAMLAAAHHERLDGSGYHLGLSAEALSLPARVLAVADVCEALSATRPYRGALAMDQVLSLLRKGSASGELCPVAVDALIGWFEGLPDDPVQLRSGTDSTSLFGI